ncbi:MAG TPA: helix-turn-helix transcriptional regulator [Anaerolineae bacterium]|nr:helix-turn-helix transcriptional regulator [Anaerolineae bacterium]
MLPHPNHRIASDGLSPQQCRILAGMAQGMLRSEVGEQLGLSIHTVRNHLIAIHRKLGAHNTTHAVALALVRGYITYQED